MMLVVLDTRVLVSGLRSRRGALMTEEYLATRAARGTERKFKAVLAKVRDVPPDPGDELGEVAKGTSRGKRRITRR
ncbi:MAG TPA: hypothetical protein VFS67_06525 [Polyangiaceae bacterium]|nr:hypothetical protein [Polyangiaceae bacterium]